MSLGETSRGSSHRVHTQNSSRPGPTTNSHDCLSSAIRRMPTATQLEQLSPLGPHFNQPEPAIICKACGFALKTDQDRVSRHLGEKHRLTKKARFGLNKLVQLMQLPDPAALPARCDGSAQHPYLELHRGAECKHCRFRSTNVDVVLLYSHGDAFLHAEGPKRLHTKVGATGLPKAHKVTRVYLGVNWPLRANWPLRLLCISARSLYTDTKNSVKR